MLQRLELQHLMGITYLDIPKLTEPSVHSSGRKQLFMLMSVSLAPPETKTAISLRLTRVNHLFKKKQNKGPQNGRYLHMTGSSWSRTGSGPLGNSFLHLYMFLFPGHTCSSSKCMLTKTKTIAWK